MTLYADRVKDTTTSTGTGAIVLAGAAPTGYQTFQTAFVTAQTVAYCIADQSGANWEVGTGVFNGTTGLSRVTVLGSSNAGALVNFTAGTKDVFCTAPAAYLDTFTSAHQGTVPASGGGTTNFLRADGTFAAPPVTAPAGSTTQVQYNNAGAFGSNANFLYVSGTNTISFGNITGSAVNMTIVPKAPTSGSAGMFSVNTQNGASANSSGGDLNFTLGSGFGTGGGGNFALTTGLTGTDQGATFIINGAFPGLGGSVVVGSGYAGSGAGGDFQFYLGGGALNDGNMYFQDPTGSNFIWLKTASSGGGAQQIGFFNATPVAKPTVTGSRATGAALVSLLNALASLGLITNSTTA
jgi:hypothetical protein